MSLSDLPDDLVLKILSHVVSFGPCWSAPETPLSACLPYRLGEHDRNEDPQQGFRASPFIAQVCRQWKRLLESRAAQELLYRHVVLDFGHELLNGVYWPLKYQNEPMTQYEFLERLVKAQLSVPKMRQFVLRNRHALSALTINVEGLWHRFLDGDEPMSSHCQFDEGDLCFLLGFVAERLQELALYSRYTRLRMTQMPGVWSSIGACTALTKLRIYADCDLTEVPLIVPKSHLCMLSGLTGLEELMLCGYTRPILYAIPQQWSCLMRLTSLELTTTKSFSLPAWLSTLPLRRLHLACLEVAGMGLLNHPTGDLSVLPMLRSLEVLALQFQLQDGLPPPAPAAGAAPTSPLRLPDLTPLAPSLKVLSLTRTRLRCLPPQIFSLTGLEILDLRDNAELWVLGDLTPLLDQLPHLRLLDWRGRPPWHPDLEELRPLNPPLTLAEFLNTQYAGLLRTRPDLAQLCFWQAMQRQGGREGEMQAPGLGGGEVQSLTGPQPSEDRGLGGEAQSLTRPQPSEQPIPAFGCDCQDPKATVWSLDKVSGCAEDMRNAVFKARELLQARPPWEPAGTVAQLGGRPLPAWRRPSAGGAHGAGPWLLLSHTWLWEDVEVTPDMTGWEFP